MSSRSNPRSFPAQVDEEGWMDGDDPGDEMPDVTDQARFTATLGITIVEQGRQAWPKFEVSDGVLAGETSEQLAVRVNSVALNGLFDLAVEGRKLLQQEIEREKQESAKRQRSGN